MKGMFERACVRLSLLAALSFLMPPGNAHAAKDVNAGLAAPYAAEASKQTVVEVLDRFAADHGLTLRVANDAARGWQTAKLDGWVRAPTGRAFLEQLAHAHHFTWFVAEQTLYVGAARDSAVERIALGGMRADSAQAALEAVGLYDARFGWGELSGQDAVLVGGPRAYRALVSRFLAGHGASSDGQAELEPMIFPLRFAQAADMPPTEAGAPARPGVAALLRQLLVREAPAAQPAFTLPAQADFPPLPAAAPPLAPWIGVPGASPAPAVPRPRAAKGAASEASEASIVADDRTNSVVVWADRRWRSRLQQLVDALDRPTSLVSFDVLVVEGDVAAVGELNIASESAYAGFARHSAVVDDRIAAAIAAHRVRLLSRQTLIGRMNARTTLAIGGEAAHDGNAPEPTAGEQANGRSGNRGDRLDLSARIVPSDSGAAPSIAVEVALLMAQPTGLPGQAWSNTTSVKLDTAITLESGAPPHLIASYPVAAARAEQRAIFISAKTL
ncbi:secretin N-terminal domain-containing protein [Trinickia dinghuensis]|nr:secretin N-terminal domain-containing protein [Trinickia dinghuensis]